METIMTTRYGLLREVEAEFLDELMLTIQREFGTLRFLEIGVAGGGTAKGIVKRCQQIGLPFHVSGVDLPVGRPAVDELPGYKFYEGDSMDMWREIKDSFNLLFIDGCHCSNHSSCDFLNYSPMVEVNGYALFHDTALETGKEAQGEYGQDHSYAG